jgi:hypothetical protein
MRKLLISLLLILLLALPANPATMVSGRPAPGGVAGGTDTVGLTDIGESTYLPVARLTCWVSFTAAHTGNVTKIEIYSSNGTASLDMEWGLYNNSGSAPSTPVASPTTFTDVGTWSAGWKSFDVEIEVTQGNTYWICSNHSAQNFTGYYDTGSSGDLQYQTLTYGDAWSNPMTPTAGNAQYSVKATVTY